MQPNIERAIQEAERIRKQYNADGISPFPYENIQNTISDLRIIFTNVDSEYVCGAIVMKDENGQKVYTIIVNTQKSATKQYFALAHELGHYFLHKEKLIEKVWRIDNEENLDARELFRLDTTEDSTERSIETEANNFAASLIMPEKLVEEAWQKLETIEECAKVFNVSILVMTIRLENLRLINE